MLQKNKKNKKELKNKKLDLKMKKYQIAAFFAKIVFV